MLEFLCSGISVSVDCSFSNGLLEINVSEISDKKLNICKVNMRK